MKYMNTIIERGTIKGTVFSGHATRTTFGNSLRVYMYISFALSFLDEIKGFYNIYVSGDDVLIACR